MREAAPKRIILFSRIFFDAAQSASRPVKDLSHFLK